VKDVAYGRRIRDHRTNQRDTARQVATEPRLILNRETKDQQEFRKEKIRTYLCIRSKSSVYDQKGHSQGEITQKGPCRKCR